MTLRALVPALALLAAGCAADNGRYPSLLPRPIEKMDLSEPTRPTPVAAPDPALDTRIAASREQLATAARDFDSAAAETDRDVKAAKGAPVGDERWVRAQSAIAELDVFRDRSASALDELQQLAIARASAGQPPYPALDAAIQAATAQQARIADRIRRYSGALTPA